MLMLFLSPISSSGMPMVGFSQGNRRVPEFRQATATAPTWALGDLGCRGGSLVIPKGFERSNLALELKAGKKRLELMLHGLTNEQCGMAGAVQSDSISGLVSHLIKNEFLALNEACERLAGSERQSSGVERRTRFVETRSQPDPHRSSETLRSGFEVVRSAIIRLV